MGTSDINKVKKSQPQRQLSLQTFHDMQNDSSTSNKTLLEHARKIRSDLGRKSIEPGLQQSLTDAPKLVAPFFAAKTLDFEVK